MQIVKISNYTVVQAGKVVNSAKAKNNPSKTPASQLSQNVSPIASIIENADLEEYDK